MGLKFCADARDPQRMNPADLVIPSFMCETKLRNGVLLQSMISDLLLRPFASASC